MATLGIWNLNRKEEILDTLSIFTLVVVQFATVAATELMQVRKILQPKSL